MGKKDILQFADILEWEFFIRLKDETAPAGKEFSYVDLLDLLDVAYKKVGISEKDKAEYDKTKTNNLDDIFAYMPHGFKEAYEAAIGETLDKNKKQIQ